MNARTVVSLTLRSARSSVFRPRVTLLPANTAFRRGYATAEQQPSGQQAGQKGKGNSNLLWAAVAGAAGIGGYYYYRFTQGDLTEAIPHSPTKSKLTPAQFQEVYNDIAKLLDSNPDYDDGSYAPVLVRLAWHASGTYSKHDKTGGSYGATMRFPVEAEWSANAGLKVARDLLEPIKKKYGDALSYSDLWSVGGVVAIQEMGGPTIKWRPGRVDQTVDKTTPDGRLPDANAEHPNHHREIFYRMGFNDQEIVALLGAHAIGRCHTSRSGFDGPWTFSPTTFSNDFYKRLLEEKWVVKKWKGPKQYVDKNTGSIMMLPTDMSLTKDKEFKKWVEIYAKDEERFFEDFAKAYQKLLELGVPFEEGTPVIEFKRL
ncbi:hypothetical protein SpCBS45565_g08205 [Spizellomyces sp. 'palustris']|nr:hypothetical protein SpCBS45565_g08205 [Spizellomyces sp. 'palustris']